MKSRLNVGVANYRAGQRAPLFTAELPKAVAHDGRWASFAFTLVAVAALAFCAVLIVATVLR